MSLSIFKRGLILLGIAKDVDAEDISRPIDRVERYLRFKTWRDVLDVFKYHHLGPRMLRVSPERIPLPQILFAFERGILRDALIRKIREKGESVMFFMSGQNDNIINLRSFRRGIRLLNLATSYSNEEIDTLFRKSEDLRGL